jgi:hypothetical protein
LSSDCLGVVEVVVLAVFALLAPCWLGVVVSLVVLFVPFLFSGIGGPCHVLVFHTQDVSIHLQAETRVPQPEHFSAQFSPVYIPGETVEPSSYCRGLQKKWKNGFDCNKYRKYIR